MNTIFRQAGLESSRDSETIVSLLNQFMSGNHRVAGTRIDGGIIAKLKKLGTARIYLCEEGNEVIGIAVCFVGFSTFQQKELLNIHDFFIREEYQGRGIGYRFLEYIQQECIQNGFCRIMLEAYDENKAAVRLYEKFGFLGNKNAVGNHLIYAMKKDL